MGQLVELNKKKDRIQGLVFNIIHANGDTEQAAEQITSVIMAKREHIEGMDGLVALQQHWTEAQCRLLIEMMS